jgi:hypothetical protein
MDSQDRQDFHNRADVYGVRILKIHGSSVKAEIQSVYKAFLIWVKQDFLIQKIIIISHSYILIKFHYPIVMTRVANILYKPYSFNRGGEK